VSESERQSPAIGDASAADRWSTHPTTVRPRRGALVVSKLLRRCAMEADLSPRTDEAQGIDRLA
jgi:hypothetical protein